MIKGLNGVLKQVSSLTKQIEKIKDMPRQVENDVEKSIESDFPSFSSIYNEKKVEADTNIGQVVDRISKAEGVDKDLVKSVMKVESNFNPQARSEDGAVGLMQLMPRTARELGVDPKNPEENIEGGVKFLGKMMDRFDDLDKALAAYNAGPAAVDRFNGVPPFDETQNYVKKVRSTFRQYKQSGNE